MKIPLRSYFSVLCFIWLGYVAGISFLEAPLKFRAPGITLPLGLGIGRIVFAALNKVEWILALAMSVLLWLRIPSQWFRTLFALLLLLLITQTFWLLPQLDMRAEMIVNGIAPPSSFLHFLYIGLEVAKLVVLLFLGIKNLQFSYHEQARH